MLSIVADRGTTVPVPASIAQGCGDPRSLTRGCGDAVLRAIVAKQQFELKNDSGKSFGFVKFNARLRRLPSVLDTALNCLLRHT